jgi:hypothetical protein
MEVGKTVLRQGSKFPTHDTPMVRFLFQRVISSQFSSALTIHFAPNPIHLSAKTKCRGVYNDQLSCIIVARHQLQN